jgi:hypothetical protein
MKMTLITLNKRGEPLPRLLNKRMIEVATVLFSQLIYYMHYDCKGQAIYHTMRLYSSSVANHYSLSSTLKLLTDSVTVLDLIFHSVHV